MMQPEVRTYLEEVRSHLYLRTDVEKQLIAELDSHLQQNIEERLNQGQTKDEAIFQAIQAFGKAEEVARLLYEACCKGTWTDALKLSLPHFLAAALFISSPLHKAEFLLLLYGVFISVSFFGWLRGKPDWLFSWLGYTLLPVFAGGFLLAPTISQALRSAFGNGAFPSAGLTAEVAIYYLLAIWLVLRISIKVIKRDWLLASLMLAPLPIVGCWMFHVQQAGGFYTGVEYEYFNQPVSQALMVLGFTSVLFIRMRRRVLKAGVAITVSAISMMGVAQSLWGDIGFFGLMGLSLVSLIIFIIPAITSAAIGHGDSLLDIPAADT
ncbi:MAG: permease prefix domain 1-containing protein [Dehalococcoidales bacterium]|nr:permease prefix domain 1-containing protein [Dehalococcoidales bacterium]MDD5499207.1 permease prefix domain 1-containing protein [Dehalococcoidales bacterium]